MAKDMTGTGREVDYLNPQPHQFDVADIARGMANTARFSGQSQMYYSVAQHCVLMSRLVSAEHALEALLWGAAKAYCGDLTAGLKFLLPDYTEIVRGMDTAIRERFGLPRTQSGLVEIANKMVLAAAYRDLMPQGTSFPLPDDIKPLSMKVHAVHSVRAQGMWLERLVELQGRVDKVAA
ncbi:MAG: putative phage hydrolase [Burkholderiaceae bacterium]|nr:putative phage hydrolase [Burkholderiaceae bacterium]